jgi:hypothetical protein
MGGESMPRVSQVPDNDSSITHIFVSRWFVTDYFVDESILKPEKPFK